MSHRLIYATALLSSVVFAASPVFGQTAPPEEGYRLTVKAQLVLLDATVTEKKTGRLIGGLTLDDFALREDGVPQTLSYFSFNRLPLSVKLVFDLTQTVQPVLAPLAAGARQAIEHLQPEDEVAVMTFSNHVSVLQDYTRDRALIESAIEKASHLYDKNTPTFIHEAVYTATELGGTRSSNSRQAEVWLTDGTANYTSVSGIGISQLNRPKYIHSKEEATQKVLESGVTVGVLLERSWMTDATLPWIPLSGKMGEINKYAEMTGGPILHTSKADVVERMGLILDALRQRYTLGYRPSVAKPDGSLCRVSLQLTPKFFAEHPGLRPKDVVVRTRDRYVR
jgi:Ca-activated chloride channel family protein